MSLKNSLKTLIFLGLNCITDFVSTKKASVLIYHSIAYNKFHFTVSPENFKKQMEYLYKKNYNVVSLNKLIEYIKNKNIPLKTIVLSFDDGYEDNYFNVFPILKKYNFPSTIFLATNFIKQKALNSFNTPLPMLSWRQIKEMHNSGLIDFEPHTHTHPRLTKISLESAKREILESRKIIEENLNKQCKFFAYPHGEYNQEIVKFLKENNFKGAVITKEGLISDRDDLFKLRRNYISSSTNFPQFKGRLNFSIEIFNFLFRK